MDVARCGSPHFFLFFLLWLGMSSILLASSSRVHPAIDGSTTPTDSVEGATSAEDDVITEAAHDQDVQAGEDVESYGYIVNHQFAGQQGAGLLALTSLQCWVQRSNLPMKIVEPFFRNSIFYGFPNLEQGIQSLGPQADARLRDVLDLEQFNSISREQGLDGLVTWEEFTAKSPRNVIVVTEADTRSERKPPKVVWSGGKDEQGHQKCYPSMRGISWMKNLTHYDQSFCIVKIVKLRPITLMSRRAPFTMDEMSDVIFGSWDPREVSLVFKWWCWHWDPWGVGQQEATTEDTRPHCRPIVKKLLYEKMVPHQELLSHAQNFEKRYAELGKSDAGKSGDPASETKSRLSVAVMLRIERVVVNELLVGRDDVDTLLQKVGSCLADTAVVTRGLEERSGGGKVFLTVDIGRLGSKSWRQRDIPNELGKQKISEMVQQTMGELLHTNLSMDQLDDLYVDVTEGKDDPGYIAAIQRVIASRADCLVILGGGNFIKLALEQYLRSHPSHAGRCVHYVCVNKRFRVEYRKLMKHIP